MGIADSDNCVLHGIFAVTIEPFSNLVTANRPQPSLTLDFHASTQPVYTPPFFTTNMRNNTSVSLGTVLISPTSDSTPTTATSSNFCHLTGFVNVLSIIPSTSGRNHSTSHSSHTPQTLHMLFFHVENFYRYTYPLGAYFSAVSFIPASQTPHGAPLICHRPSN